ncbi:hypothetical protein THAOC_03495, partial [Thalassiosira oceanica]
MGEQEGGDPWEAPTADATRMQPFQYHPGVGADGELSTVLRPTRTDSPSLTNSHHPTEPTSWIGDYECSHTHSHSDSDGATTSSLGLAAFVKIFVHVHLLTKLFTTPQEGITTMQPLPTSMSMPYNMVSYFGGKSAKAKGTKGHKSSKGYGYGGDKSTYDGHGAKSTHESVFRASTGKGGYDYGGHKNKSGKGGYGGGYGVKKNKSGKGGYGGGYTPYAKSGK